MPMKRMIQQTVTISDCISRLAQMFAEPKLMFCTGLKRLGLFQYRNESAASLAYSIV
ncbi:hypothetical protein GCK32_019853 [Trichostrongylus colubriformis]|uniref:Uncharacterized protein n=1 Tax=Trichostrongylus colubriformis TaxID=6319 RepID=A0AAN8J1X3_TRICO